MMFAECQEKAENKKSPQVKRVKDGFFIELFHPNNM
jgi:hypothetical protein